MSFSIEILKELLESFLRLFSHTVCSSCCITWQFPAVREEKYLLDRTALFVLVRLADP